ncbi:cation diffusion facilitator family transporter [Oceaniglobus indicus]|uniref:cation diffusion facilitator family transporter n=1 Tax=Oceaniglobus indicus TaxID=2047749 RepID=UPI000C1A5A77|nr:cation diffusion facilitator family transporter [Oceaniglobus indicus]
MSNDPAHTRLNQSAGLAAVAVAVVLVLAKIWAFSTTGSLSVAASLADSGMDLIMSLGALAAITYAARPPDEDHAFGHTSAEDLAALVQALFILTSAGLIAVAALVRLWRDTPAPLTREGDGMIVMVLSLILTLGLILWQGRVARRTSNRVVRADQMHYLGDLIPTVGALLSLWASSAFGLTQVDSLVALGAAIFLAVGAVRIGRGACDALMDRVADPSMVAGIEAIVRDWPGVHGFHDLKTRTAGSVVFVNLHIELDGHQSLEEAHAIGAALRRAILTQYPRCDVIIHKDIWRGDT